MKVYISGAISSDIPTLSLEAKKEVFNLAEQYLTEQYFAQGREFAVVNPLKVQPECGGTREPAGHIGQDGVPTHSWECWMKYDLEALAKCGGIIMLPFWEMSRGARVEKKYAEDLGLPVEIMPLEVLVSFALRKLTTKEEA